MGAGVSAEIEAGEGTGVAFESSASAETAARLRFVGEVGGDGVRAPAVADDCACACVRDRVGGRVGDEGGGGGEDAEGARMSVSTDGVREVDGDACISGGGAIAHARHKKEQQYVLEATQHGHATTLLPRAAHPTRTTRMRSGNKKKGGAKGGATSR